MDGTTTIKIDYYEELKEKADKLDEKEKPYNIEHASTFKKNFGIVVTTGICKCKEIVTDKEKYCSNCGQRINFQEQQRIQIGESNE